MKITKKSKIIMGVTAGVIAVAVIVTAVLLTGGNATPSFTDDPDPTKNPSEVVIQKPSDNPSGTDTTTGTEENNDDPLVLDVGGDPDATGTGGGNNDNPVKQPDKPVDPKKPADPVDTGNNGGGITIGDGGDQKPYSCGVANHKCATPESHAHITNLEIEGCKTCGSHSCASFYALDQWGYTLYTPSKCPKYDVKGDPLHYCQDCGKKTGIGTDGTCVRFINATNCPLCGVSVPARTCHSCK